MERDDTAMDQANKLEKFEKAVFAEIDIKTALVTREAEDFKNSELEKNKNKRLQTSYDEIQSGTAEIKKKFKREVAKFGLDSQRNILVKRNEITKKVFDAVKEKLLTFYNSSDYDEYLLKKLTGFSTANPLSDVEISVSEKDYKNADKLKSAYALPCSFIEDKAIKLGGFIVQDKKNHAYFDETHSNILDEQKDYFIQNSNLFL